MTKRIADLTCPECKKPIQVPFEVREPPTLDEVTNALNEALKGHPGTDEIQKVIQEQLDGLKPPKEDHRHKTADELLDCPECRSWFDKTGQKYQVGLKEPKETEKPTEQLPIGSIFSRKTGD